MFGQTSNPSFGFNAAPQNSPFGPSAFGKSIATTSFGTNAPPVFGSSTPLFSTKSSGSTTGNLFGNTTTTPTFGASTVTQSSFGGFGNANASTPLFGTQQNASTNLFGTSNTTSGFGQTNKPSSFGFGQSSGTNLFGQSQQTSQQSTAFGQSTNPGNNTLFGTTAGFGTTNSVSGISGTLVKFSPVTGSDTMIKNGVTQTISTRHHCITCMKEYESKSLEELRLEDYTAGRKGVQGQTPAIFGTGTQNSPFSNVVPNTNNGFGTVSSGFGVTSQSGGNNLFTKPITGFGAPSTTSSAFAFNSTTSSNLFNTQSKPFGATSSTPLFAASTTTSTPSATFGNSNTQNTGFGSSFTSGQTNQSIGLFAQNKSTFNMPSSSANTNFGFGQSTITNNANLFGSKPIGTSFVTPFGGVAGSTYQSGSAGFGSSQTTNPTLFNSSFKGSAQSSGFTFGNAAGNISTGLGSSGTTLFNSSTKPNLFGNSGTTATTFNTTGTFGSMPTFGSCNNSATTLANNFFGLGMSLNNSQCSTGSVPVHQQILALVSAPFGDSPLLKNLLPASGKSEQFLKPSNAISKILGGPTYKVLAGNSTAKLKPKVVTKVPLSKKSLFDGLEEEDPLLEAFQPRPNAKRLVLRPKINILNELNNKNSKNKMVDRNFSEIIPYITDKENELLDSKLANNDRRSSDYWLKSSFSRKSNISKDHSNHLNAFSSATESPLIDHLDNTVTELVSPSSDDQKDLVNESISKDIATLDIPLDKDIPDSNTYDGKSSFEKSRTSTDTEKSNNLTNKANVKLQRSGYYTIPPLDMLNVYVKDMTCIVPNFTIGRKGYGNVYFPESFDIYGLNLDEIVHFRHKEVIIYPDDNTKPPIGQGLNRKAQVTLDCVWPHDKSCHEPIVDPNRLVEMDYEGKLRKVSAKHDTKFLEYRPETGSWVFKVDHFSKYGLSDSDDDEADINKNNELKCSNNSINQFTEGLVRKKSDKNIQCMDTNHSIYDETNAAAYNLNILQEYPGDENQFIYSPSSMHAQLTGTRSHKLQLMKASFFGYADDDSIKNSVRETKIKSTQENTFYNNTVHATKYKESVTVFSYFHSSLQTHDYEHDSNMADNKNKCVSTAECLKSINTNVKTKHIFIMPNIRPKTTILKFKTWVIPSNYFMFYKNKYKYISDMGIQMAKTFRCSWGPQLSLVSLSSQQHENDVNLYNVNEHKESYINTHKFYDITNIVQQTQLFGGSNLHNGYVQRFKSSIEGHLKLQLQYSKIDDYENCPIIITPTDSTSIAALDAHTNHSIKVLRTSKEDKTASYFCSVWKLCKSLWGNHGDSQTFSSTINHESVMLRKEALSDWLKFITAEIVQNEITTVESNDEVILSLLSANKLEEACKSALKFGDHSLALLLSQMGGTLKVRELLKQQIELWKDTKIDETLSLYRLKLFMLIAGVPVIVRNNETINVCEKFDWKRALAVHLWYFSTPTASIADVLDLYDSSFLTMPIKAYSPGPQPDYIKTEFQVEISNNKCIYDLCYHLLKLYCTGNYPLEAILNPQSYTYDPLDYRLSWLIQQMLISLGYMHLSDHTATLTHANFAAQLEAFDLWHWAIFVILHINDSKIRRKSVLDLLLRHVEIDKSLDYIERENFLEIKLKIPSKWINQAKGIKACSMKRYGEAAWYFIQAQEWNKAHEIVIEYLATDAIINEDYDYLKSLLSPLMQSNCSNSISGWSYQGQLIWDYIIIITEVKCLLNIKNCNDVAYKLELLQPQLISLCTKISIFPCSSVKHRLCQAEMAKRTLQLAKSLFILHSKIENNSDYLVHLISQLPLPEDYVQQELRPIISICINNIISQ